VDLGPVEYVLIDFPGNRFTGHIVPALASLVESGTVRILDLVFISKDADGAVTTFEFDQLDDELGYAAIEGAADGVMSDEDLTIAAAGLDPESSALLIVWEDRWAAELAAAVRAAGGRILAGERIPHEIAVAALEGIDD
jgi:hypothetical protein